MARSGAPQTDGASTRERILEVAEQLIARDGIDGFQLKDVAEEVGIRPPSIFAHFRGREALGEAVAMRIVEKLAGVLIAEFEQEADPEDMVRRTMRALVAHLAGHPAHVRLMLRDIAQAGAGRRYGQSDNIVDVVTAKVAEVVDRGVEQGCFRQVETSSLIAMMQGAMLANVAYDGWDENGALRRSRKLEDLQNDAEELAISYLLAR